ncbi:MAG TPA: DegT/DnrJ/EryC1/StrS family aminotransferase [Candidatus Paceibacterota bacterium]
MNGKIKLMQPNVGDEELRLVEQVIKSGNLVEGKMVEEFERTVCEFTGAKYAIACTSATTGLELALRTLDIGKGDEVIIPDFTHPATALVVQTVGATPILVDVDLESYNTNAEYIRKAVTKRTKAIIPVSIFGNPLEMDAIMSIGKKNNIPIIEDAACSLGSEYKSKKVGNLADITVFSFHPRKIFSTGDGGLITTNNRDRAELMMSIKRFGAGEIGGKNTFVRWGTNYRMSDILGAVALGQVRKISQIVEDRIKKAKIYNELLSGVEEVTTPKIEDFSKSNYQTYAILIKNDKRDGMMQEMRGRNIEVQIGTYALHLLPVFMGVKKVGDLRNSLSLSQNLLSLPLHAGLTLEQQKYVVENLRSLL